MTRKVIRLMPVTRNDGGRAAAGYRGVAGDCACRAIAIATGTPYRTAYDALNVLAALERRRDGRRSSARTGMFAETANAYIRTLGWTWTPTMGIGTGCRVHLRHGDLPAGRLIVRLSKHWTAVVDGTIHDLFDPQRDGTRCVYGYWHKP